MHGLGLPVLSGISFLPCGKGWGAHVKHLQLTGIRKLKVETRSGWSNTSMLCQCIGLIEMNEEATFFDAVLLSVCTRPWWRGEEELLMGSLWLSRCLGLCGVQIKKWGGQEVEESSLIIPIWPSHQIPNSAGRQLSWFCQVTVISHSQRQLN